MEPFIFTLGQDVKLAQSGEQGIVIARAEYLNSEDAYLVRYKAGDGRQVEHWWGRSALEAN